MATKKEAGDNSRKQSFSNLQRNIRSQFQGLNMNDPGQWPLFPRLTVYVLTVVFVVLLAWLALLQNSKSDLDMAVNQEEVLKRDYSDKAAQAANLEALDQQQKEIKQYVKQLEDRLPNKANMDMLLAQINAAGLANNLQFDTLRAEPIVVRDYYAEQPITISVSGVRYNDVASFAAALAELDRIVTLDNITLEQAAPAEGSSGSVVPTGEALKLTATIKTYRYLDANEVRANQEASQRI